MKLGKYVVVSLFAIIIVIVIFTWNSGSKSHTPNYSNSPQRQSNETRGVSRADDSTYAEEVKTLTAQMNQSKRENEEKLQASNQTIEAARQEIENLKKEISEMAESFNKSLNNATASGINKGKNVLNSTEDSIDRAARIAKSEFDKAKEDVSKSIHDRINKKESEPKTQVITIAPPSDSSKYKTPLNSGNNFSNKLNFNSYGGDSMTPDGYLAIRPFDDPNKPRESGFSGALQGFKDGISGFTTQRITTDPKSKTNPFAPTISTGDQKLEPIPVYTIPVSSTLANNTSLSPLVGVVPDISNNVNDPYRFRIITGNENLASNGHHINGVENIVWSGYVVGVRDQSCVRAYVDTITYTFEDGRVSTYEKGRSQKSSASGSFSGMDALGYLTDEYGKPCIRGQYISNATKYLRDRSLAAFLGGLAEATSQSQMKYLENNEGDLKGFVTGNTGKYIAGAGLAGSFNEISKYVGERAAGAFDVIYVDSGINVQLFVEQEIPIDYDFKSRKINYEYYQD